MDSYANMLPKYQSKIRTMIHKLHRRQQSDQAISLVVQSDIFNSLNSSSIIDCTEDKTVFLLKRIPNQQLGDHLNHKFVKNICLCFFSSLHKQQCLYSKTVEIIANQATQTKILSYMRSLNQSFFNYQLQEGDQFIKYFTMYISLCLKISQKMPSI